MRRFGIWVFAITLLTPIGVFVCSERACLLTPPRIQAVGLSPAEIRTLGIDEGLQGEPVTPILLTRNGRPWAKLIPRGPYRRDDPALWVGDVYLEMSR